MTQDLTAGWRVLSPIDSALLCEARIAAHYAVQWLGRFGRACVVPAADDSHTALTWDAGQQALTSAMAQTENGTVQVSFSFGDFALSVHKGDAIAASIPLDGMSDAEVGAWTAGALAALNVKQPLDTPLPYEMPASALADGEVYDLSPIQSGLHHLEILFANAAGLLDALRQSEARALPVRCWPHHFDIASLIAIDAQTSEDARSIGVGVSPGDDTYIAPYIYVTPWPYPEKDRLSALPAPGHWHTDGYIGAILQIPDLVDQADQRAALASFLTDSFDQSATLLGDRA